MVELLIAIAIIVILASMAIPSYTKMRSDTKKAICIANLRQIDGAIEQWSILNDVDEGVRLRNYEEEIYEYLHGDPPTCPSGGTYRLRRLGTYPQVTCNIDDHELPE